MKAAARIRFLAALGLVGAAGILTGQTLATPQLRSTFRFPPSMSLPPGSTLATTLVFDREAKTFDAAHGEAVAPFAFKLTNVGTTELVITNVHPSCGCTTAHLPPLPWRLAAGESGNVQTEVKLAGRMGMITKTLTFYTTAGVKVITLNVNITPAPPPGELTGADRRAAMLKAAADSKAIFGTACASCHVDKGVSAFGQDLYAADCAICHESSHRASAVPDLHALKQPTDLAYWKTIITYGKPHTLMPGFSRQTGGPLTDQQVASLATYLDQTLSHHF